MADIGRDEADMGDNSFLDIRNYQYDDDDDVELLGVSLMTQYVEYVSSVCPMLLSCNIF